MAFFRRIGSNSGTDPIHQVAIVTGAEGDVPTAVSDTNAVPVKVVSGGGSGGGATTIADGADVAQGATADAAWSGTGAGTVVAVLKAIRNLLAATLTVSQASLPNTTDRSGSATTTSGAFNVAANANRKFLVGQNNGTVAIAFNEQGGTAALNAAGSYTVPAGSSFSISSNKLINFISASGTVPVTLTEG